MKDTELHQVELGNSHATNVYGLVPISFVIVQQMDWPQDFLKHIWWPQDSTLVCGLFFWSRARPRQIQTVLLWIACLLALVIIALSTYGNTNNDFANTNHGRTSFVVSLRSSIYFWTLTFKLVFKADHPQINCTH